MRTETSYGIIPIKKQGGSWIVLLINHSKGTHWGFPKGHAEKGENSIQAAERELLEETGLTIKQYITSKPLEEHYMFFSKGVQVYKSVIFFLAEVEGNLQLQPEEIADSRWVPLVEAEQHLSFKESRHLCQQAIAFLAQIQ